MDAFSLGEKMKIFPFCLFLSYIWSLIRFIRALMVHPEASLILYFCVFSRDWQTALPSLKHSSINLINMPLRQYSRREQLKAASPFRQQHQLQEKWTCSLVSDTTSEVGTRVALSRLWPSQAWPLLTLTCSIWSTTFFFFYRLVCAS